MSKGTNISFNMPTDLWEKLLAQGNPATEIIAAVEFYLSAPVLLDPLPEEAPAAESAPVKGGKKS